MEILENKQGLTLEKAFEEFLVSRMATGVKDKTLKTYRLQAHAISRHTNPEILLNAITKHDIDLIIVSMRTSGLKSTSIQTYTRLLRTFFNWSNAEGYTNIKIKLYHAEDTMKEPYTDEELHRLLHEPEKDAPFWEVRDWAIVNFLLNSGCRAATLRAIQIGDIDLEKNIVYFRHTKNGQGQVMPLCSHMQSVLQRYLLIRHGNPRDPLFCSRRYKALSEDSLKKAIVRYNHSRSVQKTSIHLFRHTFAKKYLLDGDGDAFTLQHLLGHKTIEMTKKYCNLYDADIVKRFESICPLAILTSQK